MEDIQNCNQHQPVVEIGSLLLSVYYPDQEGPILSKNVRESELAENDEPLCLVDEKESKNVVLNIIQVNYHLRWIQNCYNLITEL